MKPIADHLDGKPGIDALIGFQSASLEILLYSPKYLQTLIGMSRIRISRKTAEGSDICVSR